MRDALQLLRVTATTTTNRVKKKQTKIKYIKTEKNITRPLDLSVAFNQRSPYPHDPFYYFLSKKSVYQAYDMWAAAL